MTTAMLPSIAAEWVLPAAFSGVLGLLGVVAGGAIAWRAEKRARQNARNEKLIELYAAWQSSLNAQLENDHQWVLALKVVVDPRVDPRQRAEFLDRFKRLSGTDNELSKKREEDAHAAIFFYDFGSKEAAAVDRIRAIQPGKASGVLSVPPPEASVDAVEQLERARLDFLKLQDEQARLMGLLARDVAHRFRVV